MLHQHLPDPLAESILRLPCNARGQSWVLHPWQRQGLEAAHRILMGEDGRHERNTYPKAVPSTNGSPPTIDFSGALGTHIYVQSPPGTGKSLYMYAASQSLVPRMKGFDDARPRNKPIAVIVVNQTTIVDQHRAAFLGDFRCVGAPNLLPGRTFEDEQMVMVSPTGVTIAIMTWQALSLVRKQPGFPPVGLLMFDECHVGGGDVKNTSFPTIVETFQPRKCMFVSATCGAAHAGLLGPKTDASYVHKLSDAFAAKLLNQTEMVEVHTGTLAHYVRLSDLAQSLGKGVKEIEAADFDKADFDKAEIDQSVSHRSLVEQAEWNKAHQVGDPCTSAVLKTALFDKERGRILRTQHNEMIEVYLRRHALNPEERRGGEHPPAIFFCPSQHMAEWAASQFNIKAQRLAQKGRVSPNIRAFAVHDAVPNRRDLIDRFRRQPGGPTHVTAVFVVGMLQEGFDMTDLYLAFDCNFFFSWNVAKTARLLQRVGRVLRVNRGEGWKKPISRYYYSRNIAHFYDFSAAKVSTPKDASLGDDVETQRDAIHRSRHASAGVLGAAEDIREENGAGRRHSNDDPIHTGKSWIDRVGIISGDEGDGGDGASAKDDGKVEKDGDLNNGLDIGRLKTVRSRPKRKDVTLVHTYMLRDASEHVVMDGFCFSKLFWQSEDDRLRLEQLLDLIAQGGEEPKWVEGKGKNPLYDALSQILGGHIKGRDELLAAYLARPNPLIKWERIDLRLDEMKGVAPKRSGLQQLLDLIAQGGEQPQRGKGKGNNPLYTALSKILCRRPKAWDELLAAYLARPNPLIKWGRIDERLDELNGVAPKRSGRQQLLDLIAQGGEEPKSEEGKNPLYVALSSILYKRTKVWDEFLAAYLARPNQSIKWGRVETRAAKTAP